MYTTVARGDESSKAPEIIHMPLCTTLATGREVGKVFLYKNGENVLHYTLSFLYKGKLYPNQIVRFRLPGEPVVILGRIIDIAINVTTTTIKQTITIEKWGDN